MPPAKYAPLGDFVYRKHASRVVDFSMSFGEFEAVIGADLPPSARKYRLWWAKIALIRKPDGGWRMAGRAGTSIWRGSA